MFSKNILKPKTLRLGDTVSLVSVSSPVPEDVIEASRDYLLSLGLNVVVGKNVGKRFGYMAGTIQDRIHDLHTAFYDENISAIFCAYGGTSSNQILPYIDYSLIRKNNKIFMGLSDSSSISLAIYAKSNCISFHGPTGYNFGQEGMSAYTEKYFKKVLFSSDPLGTIETDNDWVAIKKGFAEGEVIGANLSIIQSLIGTPFEPDWRKKILFWEDLFMEYHTIDLILTQLKIAGILHQIAGMVIGKLVECKEEEYETDETFEEIISRICQDSNFPILSNVNLGHTKDKISIPIGTRAKLLVGETINFEFTESATQ